jgi:hypothetical protein
MERMSWTTPLSQHLYTPALVQLSSREHDGVTINGKANLTWIDLSFWGRPQVCMVSSSSSPCVFVFLPFPNADASCQMDYMQFMMLIMVNQI